MNTRIGEEASSPGSFMCVRFLDILVSFSLWKEKPATQVNNHFKLVTTAQYSGRNFTP